MSQGQGMTDEWGMGMNSDKILPIHPDSLLICQVLFLQSN